MARSLSRSIVVLGVALVWACAPSMEISSEVEQSAEGEAGTNVPFHVSAPLLHGVRDGVALEVDAYVAGILELMEPFVIAGEVSPSKVFARLEEPNSGDARRQRNVTRALLNLDPNQDGHLTLSELEALARQSATVIDGDHDGVLGVEEIAAYAELIAASRELADTDCVLPSPSPEARVLAVSIYEGAALSTVAIDGPDEPTYAATVRIEPGSEPLYILLQSHGSIIWKFEGDLSRVERVALLTDYNGAGATGLEKERVAFSLRGGCAALGASRPAASSDAAHEAVIGRVPDDRFSGQGTAVVVNLPSGAIITGREGQESAEGEIIVTSPGGLSVVTSRGTESVYGGAFLPFRPASQPAVTPVTYSPKGTVDPLAWYDLLQFHPGGITITDPSQVVSVNQVERYDVLPQEAGLVQLLREGKLERRQQNGNYAVVAPIPRLPAGLTGANFIFAPGVPLPAGGSGNLCAFLEETRAPVVGSEDRCTWRDHFALPRPISHVTTMTGRTAKEALHFARAITHAIRSKTLNGKARACASGTR